jgi:DNA-binding transcriptional LysR family regulator
MTIMDTIDVKAFLAVAQSGSISRAATELNLTQPAVTRRIQRFERAVGVPLIDRRRRPVGVTPLGLAAIERCRRIVSIAEALNALSQSDVGAARELHIGVAHALSELALSESVDRLRRDCPSVAMHLHTGWSRHLLSRVKSGALDAAVILLPEGESLPGGVRGNVLGKEHLAIIVSREKRSPRRQVGELGDVTWVLSPEGCAAREALRRELARAGLPLRVGVETYNYELQLALVARGRGLGLVPSRLLGASRSRTRLRVVKVRGLHFPLTIWMVIGEVPPTVESHVAVFGDPLAELLRERTARMTGARARSAGSH